MSAAELRNSTFLPGGIASRGKLPLDAPYIFTICLAGSIIAVLLLLFIRELCKSRTLTQGCCGSRGALQCPSCFECGASSARACDCCQTTSMDSCLDACCPKRGSMDMAELITCEMCCSNGRPTDTSCLDCLCGNAFSSSRACLASCYSEEAPSVRRLIAGCAMNFLI